MDYAQVMEVVREHGADLLVSCDTDQREFTVRRYPKGQEYKFMLPDLGVDEGRTKSTAELMAQQKGAVLAKLQEAREALPIEEVREREKAAARGEAVVETRDQNFVPPTTSHPGAGVAAAPGEAERSPGKVMAPETARGEGAGLSKTVDSAHPDMGEPLPDEEREAEAPLGKEAGKVGGEKHAVKEQGGKK